MSVIQVKVPNVAESITEVRIANWLVKNGDFVKIDASLCEIETDKATQELYAEAAGVVSLIAKEGDDVQVGAVICSIDTAAVAPAAQPVSAENYHQFQHQLKYHQIFRAWLYLRGNTHHTCSIDYCPQWLIPNNLE